MRVMRAASPAPCCCVLCVARCSIARSRAKNPSAKPTGSVASRLYPLVTMGPTASYVTNVVKEPQYMRAPFVGPPFTAEPSAKRRLGKHTRLCAGRLLRRLWIEQSSSSVSQTNRILPHLAARSGRRSPRSPCSSSWIFLAGKENMQHADLYVRFLLI